MGSMFCDKACQEDCYHLEAGFLPNLLKGKSSPDYRVEKVPVINNKPPGSDELGHISALSTKRKSVGPDRPPGSRKSVVVLSGENEFSYTVVVVIDGNNNIMDNEVIPIYRDYEPGDTNLLLGYQVNFPVTGDMIKRGIKISFTNLYAPRLSGFVFKGDLNTLLTKSDAKFIQNNTESTYIKLVKRTTMPHPELILDVRHSKPNGYYVRALFLRYNWDILEGHLPKRYMKK